MTPAVAEPPARYTVPRRAIWGRPTFQMGVGLLLAVLLPWAVRVSFAIEELEWPGLQNSLIGTTVALAVGYYGFRRLSRYPGVRAYYNILPTFAVTYGLVLALFFFARLDYSRLHFSVSFLLCLLWYYLLYFNLRRQRLRIGFVPVGGTDRLTGIDEVVWVDLTKAETSSGQLDMIVADLRADLDDRWERFLADRALDGMLVMHVKQLEESLTGRVAIEHLSENNLGSLIPGIVYGRVKRIGDVLAAVVALPLLAPFMLAIAVAIRLDSKGPIFFRQERIGYRGSTFRMIKFRTMRADTDPTADPRLAAMTDHEDMRVTRVGRFLRRRRLDELPQIVNVLKGEMSWIGPRPEAIPLSRWYEAELPFYRYRHIVRPGITGWAQLRQGHVANVDEVLEKLHYDFYYIRNFSFWLDLLILAGTIRVIVSGYGAR
ncbi:sugar transferase [Sphingosinicella terrae]|uniref:sugar transferase n=1 Tax=Sphingosinicella terrae TaxID=2172047 RepID=UPI000E0DB84B|nr:sugar transferase [Sphingosinicella terrae]